MKLLIQKANPKSSSKKISDLLMVEIKGFDE